MVQPANVIDYATIASTGNATDFGDSSVTVYGHHALSSSTRFVGAGGDEGPQKTNVIDYVTIASTGNATDFGDLLAANQDMSSFSSGTRGVWGGGTPAESNILQYITIASQVIQQILEI